MRSLRPSAPSASDILAGLSVALVLIPQSMAYAELAGLPPQVGLFAAALPPLFAAPFVSSPYLQTGPVALTSLLTFGALEGIDEPFSARYVALAALLAVMVGVFRMLLGAIRLGTVAYLLSNPVLSGFTTGAAILIVASQFPRAVGADLEDNGVLGTAFDAITSPGEWNSTAIVFSVVTATLMLGGRRMHPLFPGVLIAVLASVVLSRVIDYDGPVIGELPGDFPQLQLDLPWGSTPGLIPAAAAIALVGFAEPSSIARAFAAQDRQTWNANREMFSQGVANLVSGLSGGFPVGGSFSRSSLNRLAGATSGWAGATTGVTVLLVLPLTPLAESLPRAVLAALVITSVVKLINLRRLVVLVRESWPQGVVGFGTLAATLGFAPRVERGVLVGVVLAISVHLYRELTVTVSHQIRAGTLTVRPQGVLWFATVPQIERLVRTNVAEHPEITTVRFDLSGVGRLDYTGAATLELVIATLRASGVKSKIVNIPPGAKRAARIHLSETIDDP